MLITIVYIHIFATESNYLYFFMSKQPILLLFGKSVQQQRKKQGLSQEQLAEKAGVHRTYIGMVERAEKNITLCNIERIANALNISITELLNF